MEFIEKTINTTKKQNKAKTECRSKVNKLVSEAKVVHARHMDNAKKSYEVSSIKIILFELFFEFFTNINEFP